MIRLDMRTRNMMSTEMQQKCRFYHIEKLRNTSILQVIILQIFSSNQGQIIGQAKFTYSPLAKAFEKQTKTTEEQGKRKKILLQIKAKNYGL